MVFMISLFILQSYLNQMMDLVEEIQSYSPQTGNAKPGINYSIDPQNTKQVPFITENLSMTKSSVQSQQKKQEGETGCTRFCRQKYYEQYFRVNEQEVKQRIMSTVIPPFNGEFLDKIKENPDFYGPFWILTTIIFLLGVVGNFANYVLSKFSNDDQWQGYFFKLQLVRYAVVMIYSFGAGVPLTLFFMFKFMKCNELSFPEVSCLYGYSLCCFIPALLLCIIPFEFLQWILMIYALANSSLFLVVNLKGHIQGAKGKVMVVIGVICGMQLVLMLCCKLIFINLGVDLDDDIN